MTVMEDGRPMWAVLGVLSVGLVLRVCVGCSSYSGMNSPPMYGDYEAQRHWMEITLNLPAQDWYRETTENNLSYWGLDYPPLSAYQSVLSGKVVELFDPKATELVMSQGYESKMSKLGMRFSVILSDLFVYLPSCLLWTSTAKTWGQKIMNLVWMVWNPALTIVDHGHFQYNSISLGLTMASITLLEQGHYALGSVMFCAALNHKQMTLYFAPAIFAHLLGRCAQKQGTRAKLTMFTTLGITVMLSFALIWSPFLTSLDLMKNVLGRIFPFQRGLFEDYVANFWCVSSLIFKWKRYFSANTLARMCASTTLLFAMPSLYMEFRQPSHTTLPLTAANTAMSFFLFSYQVHEKSILVPLTPLLMLLRSGVTLATPAMVNVSLLSMYPLLKKDGLMVAYWAMQIVAFSLQLSMNKTVTPDEDEIKDDWSCFIRRMMWSPTLVLAGIISIHAVCHILQPLSSKPFLSDAIIMASSFCYFVAHTILTNWYQFKVREKVKSI